MKPWEIRCLFGNEYALDMAFVALKKNGIEDVLKLDRRYISIRFGKRDKEREELAKRIVEMNHGFVESEAPLGEYDRKVMEAKIKKLKREEKKSH
jgi:hypothetical protein